EDFHSSLDEWRSFCERIAASDWLTGKSDRGWCATFAWVLEPKNLRKVVEGNYDNRPGRPVNGSGRYASDLVKGQKSGRTIRLKPGVADRSRSDRNFIDGKKAIRRAVLQCGLEDARSTGDAEAIAAAERELYELDDLPRGVNFDDIEVDGDQWGYLVDV